MKPNYRIGDRVRLSELGQRAARKPNRAGTIFGISKTGSQYRVKWDDAKFPQLIHGHYLELEGRPNLK
jgi:hypothetical protein